MNRPTNITIRRAGSVWLSVFALAWMIAAVSDVAAPADPSEPTVEEPSTDSATSETTPANAETDKAQASLGARQEVIAGRFIRFRKTLLQMAEYMAKTDPERADLLIRAIGQSNTAGVVTHMKRIAELLERSEPLFGDAVDRQEDVIEALSSLLELLQSEDRRSELEQETQRLQELLKQLGKLIGKEKDIRAATERNGDSKRLAHEQDKLHAQTDDLVNEIDAHDATRNAGGKSDEKAPEKTVGDSQEPRSESDKPNSETDSERSESGRQNGADGGREPPKQAHPTQNAQKAQRTPGRDDIEQARREMERAAEKLKLLANEQASEHQDEAIAKMREAKDKLEQVLRQLREEERKLFLATMEARFQKMLAMQLLVYNGTVQLAKVPEADRTSRHASRSIKLARDEEAVVVEASMALGLLKEEGSSVAFPEALEQMRDDMVTVVHLLERAKVARLTQEIEREIIAALEEMIEAFQKEMEDSDDAEQQPQEQQEQGPPERPGLVDAIAELKMLRSLQFRINRRTKSIAADIEDEQATDPDLVDQLRQLAERQSRVQQATYDLAVGRNR